MMTFCVLIKFPANSNINSVAHTEAALSEMLKACSKINSDGACEACDAYVGPNRRQHRQQRLQSENCKTSITNQLSSSRNFNTRCLENSVIIPEINEIVSKSSSKFTIFTARFYASAVLAMGLCLSVRLSQVEVLLKWLNIGSHKQHHTIAQGLQFSDARDLREIRPGSPPTRAPNAGGVGQNRR